MVAEATVFSFAAGMRVAAVAPAMLAVMALTAARQAYGNPALTWWAAGLGTEALRPGALAAASTFDPSCFPAIHAARQATLAFLPLGGALRSLVPPAHSPPLPPPVSPAFAGPAPSLLPTPIPLP